MNSNVSVQDIIHGVLEEGPASFEEIFAAVESVYKSRWEIYANHIKMSYEDLLVKKRGEIYTLLIVDGKTTLFAEGVHDGTWKLR